MVRSILAFSCVAVLTVLSAGSNIQEIFKDTTCDEFAMVTLKEWIHSLAVAPETDIALETYQLNLIVHLANCKHRWHTTDKHNVLFRETRCYIIDRQRCEGTNLTVKFTADRCGRAQAVPAGKGNFVLKFYSTDLDLFFWQSSCYEWDTKGDCTLGFMHINVKESLLSKYDKKKIQTTKRMLERKYNIKFSNAKEEFKDKLQECQMN